MFTLDTNAAKKADAGYSKISQLGKYIGTIERAVVIKSKEKGTNGVELHFKSDAGESAVFGIYTSKSDGEKLSGHNLMMAVMACLSLRAANTKEQTYKVWDNDQKSETSKVLTGLPDFEGKKIGVLVETEDSEYKGKIYTNNPIPVMFFHAESELTATEILNKQTEPQAVAKRVMTLKHRPLKNAKATTANQAETSKAIDDDDIPF